MCTGAAISARQRGGNRLFALFQISVFPLVPAAAMLFAWRGPSPPQVERLLPSSAVSLAPSLLRSTSRREREAATQTMWNLVSNRRVQLQSWRGIPEAGDSPLSYWAKNEKWIVGNLPDQNDNFFG